MNEMTSFRAAPRVSGLVSTAQALRPLINDHREAIATGPDLPLPVANALIRAGLTQLWLPRSLGGLETPPLDFFAVIEALARLDGAVAWCAMISSAASRFAGLIAADPMRRLLPPETMLAFSGSGHPTGSATRDNAGWRITGRWSWASFSRHSTISSFMCVEQADGAPRLTAEGAPVLRAVLLPSEKVQVLGNWNSGGLRSSGSHDVTCSDVWVPDGCTTSMEMTERQPGPLYNLPFFSSFAISVMAVPLGIAAASIDDLVTLARTKVAFLNTLPICEHESVQLDVAMAKTRLQTARAFAIGAIGSMWASVSSGQPASIEQQALLRMACWNAGDAAKEVVGRMYAAAGSSAVLEEVRFAAQLRDVHAVCQHINFATRLMVAPGRIMLGLEPGTGQI